MFYYFLGAEFCRQTKRILYTAYVCIQILNIVTYFKYLYTKYMHSIYMYIYINVHMYVFMYVSMYVVYYIYVHI